MKPTVTDIIREQCAKVPPVLHEDLSGQTVIVVGANTGIGFEAAKHFASMNPGKLILACRDQKRGDDALNQIKQDVGFDNMEVSLLDLATFASVNAFADRFEKSGQRLDILVANAAIAPASLAVTPDGWETCFQVNNLSTNLLCLLLLPSMLRTARDSNTVPRMVVVSSELHYFAQISPKVLEAKNPVTVIGKEENITTQDIGARYYDSKLFNVLFVRALNDRLNSKSVIINAVNPGFCASSLRRDLPGIQRILLDWLAVKLLGRTSEEGSRQLVWAAVGGKDQTGRLSGAYISSMQVFEPSDFVISEQGKLFQDKLWDNMLTELTLVSPKVRSIISSCLRS